VRGFSFDREVQPVLDHRCVGCHNGQPVKMGGRQITTFDLRAKQLLRDYTDRYSPAYLALQRYVRRAGYETDMHLQTPAEYEADTSPLVQLLKKGHYNVKLSRDDWERLYTWIDYNVPYPANWRESHRPPRDEQVERRAAYKKQFAGLIDDAEAPLPLPPVAKYEPPQPGPARPTTGPTVPGWPMTAEQAAKLQKKAGPVGLELDLGDGVTVKFRLIPAGNFVMGDIHGAPDEWTSTAVRIEQPFYLGQFEVTNQQYAEFDRRHDSGYIEGRGKDRTTRGTPVNQPDAPAVRISWNEALAFCEWLSQKTRYQCTLPTEAQWEWACRAGTASRFSFGDALHNDVMNIADGRAAGWNYGRGEPGYNDGNEFVAPVGRFPQNPWGLADMHGNVAEWCLSNYRPYPYRADDGRDDPGAAGLKVVRGGSWNDLSKDATSSARWRYQPYQSTCTVGFRVLVELDGDATLKTAAK
jgi:formylglycine-generating enzyme required for sulfatase activity